MDWIHQLKGTEVEGWDQKKKKTQQLYAPSGDTAKLQGQT